MKRPSFQFYPADWRNDSSLKVCSLQARGLWVEMLCLLHELGQQDGSRYGYLELRGNPLSGNQFSRLIGIELAELNLLIDELELAGVFSKDSKGVIYSRRLVRDGKLKQIRSKAGSKGGSKTEAKEAAKRKQNIKQNGSKTSSKTEAKRKQPSRTRPYGGALAEVEVEEEEEDNNKEDMQKEKTTPKAIVALYHELCPSLPRVLQVSEHRRKAINSRAADFKKNNFQEQGLGFRQLFLKAEASDFLTGRAKEPGRGFCADLSWLLNLENLIKTLEGKYDNRTTTKQIDRDYANAFILKK